MPNKTNDDIFIDEFSKMMTYRRNSGGATNEKYALPNIPIPDFPHLIKGNTLAHYARVGKITEPYFSELNMQLVEVLPDRTWNKKQALSTGGWRKDSKGEYMTTEVSIAPNSRLIKSNVNIQLRNYEVDANGNIRKDGRGNNIKHTLSDGFAYYDYESKGNERSFVYTIPKANLFKANMTALVLSLNKRSNCYYGWRIAFTNGVYMHLSVINFVRSQCDNTTRVLGIGNKVDYRDEIAELVNMWATQGFLFDKEITQVGYREAHVNAPDNLSFTYYTGSLSIEAYTALQSADCVTFDIDSDVEDNSLNSGGFDGDE